VVLLLALIACGTPGLDDMTGELPEGAELEVLPESEVLFDRTPAGVRSLAQVTISNLGDQSSIVEDLWFEGNYADDFALESHEGVPGKLEPGDEIVITLAFDPPATGRFVADLYVSAPETPSGGITRPLVGLGCTDADGDNRCD